MPRMKKELFQTITNYAFSPEKAELFFIFSANS